MCSCGSRKDFEGCCEPFLDGRATPATAEQLMRSRYSAYTRARIDYIKSTMAPESSADFDETSARQWAEEAKWVGLKILSTDNGNVGDLKGTVEFMATYEHNGETLEHHEVAQFRKDSQGKWLFVDGDAHVHKEGETHHHKHQPMVRESPKIGRNDPCICGSGKKFKKCCEGKTGL